MATHTGVGRAGRQGTVVPLAEAVFVEQPAPSRLGHSAEFARRRRLRISFDRAQILRVIPCFRSIGPAASSCFAIKELHPDTIAYSDFL